MHYATFYPQNGGRFVIIDSVCRYFALCISRNTVKWATTDANLPQNELSDNTYFEASNWLQNRTEVLSFYQPV